LVFLAGEFDPAIVAPVHAAHGPLSVGGMGLTLRNAFQSCIGEGVEYLSPFEDGTELLINCTLSGLLASATSALKSVFEALPLTSSTAFAALCAEPLDGAAHCLLLASICLRRTPSHPAFEPPLKLSMGCAAGRTK
jgi:ribosomal protein S12 methylthiotransferase accessory factor